MMTDHFAINCLARWLAKKTVKAQLQRQRIKLHSIPAADVTRAANAWLDITLSFMQRPRCSLSKYQNIRTESGGLILNDNLCAALRCRMERQNDHWVCQS